MKICKSCHAGCCRNYTVSLTGYDVLNIADTLSVPPESFADFVSLEDGADIEYKSKHAAIFQFSDRDGYYVLGLKMVESILVPRTAKCQFLVEWNTDNEAPTLGGIIARCGIYGCRPLLCAAFPTKFDTEQIGGVMVNTSAFEQNFEHPIYRTCPESPSCEDIKASDEIIKILVLKKYEVEYFKTVAAQWNKEPKSSADFFEFLAQKYKNRVVIE